MSIDIAVVKCVIFQLINPKDGTRTSVVTLPQTEVLAVLKKCSQEAFINVMSLDSTVQDDVNFCLHPLVRVSSFVDFYIEQFQINHEGVDTNETV